MDPNQDFTLKPTGRICLGEGLPLFQKEAESALACPESRIVLDLAEVTYIDSSGIGEILKLFLESKNKGKQLVLAKVPPAVQKVFRSTRLDKVFNILP